MQKLVIAKALTKDISDILKIQKAAFLSEAQLYGFHDLAPLKETLAGIRKDLARHTILKAAWGTKIIGSVRGYREGATCYIGRLSVHPRSWGNGAGTSLMAAIEEYFPDVRRYELFTGTRSDRNINLYLRLGYNPYKFARVSKTLTFVYMEKERL